MNAVDLTREMLEKSIDQDSRKHDHAVSVADLSWNNDGNLVVPVDQAQLFGSSIAVATATEPMTLTDHAMMQVANRLGKTVFKDGSNKRLPVDYLQAMKPYLRATVLNDHVKDAPNETWLVRGYETTCRAVLSERYGVFANTDMLQMLYDVMEGQTIDEDVRIVRSDVSPDSLNYKIVWKDTGRPDGGGGTYGIGFYVGNGETGQYKARIYPLIWRGGCSNTAIVKEGYGYEFKHIGSLSAHRVNVQAQIVHIFPQAAELVEKMIVAEGQRLPKFSDVLNGLAKQYGWTEEEKLTVAAGTEGKETRAGIVNGVTYAAHRLHSNKPDVLTEWETLGGSLLVGPDSVFSRARKVAEIERAKIGAEL